MTSIEQAPRGCGDLSRWLAWQENAHPKTWDLGLMRIGTVWKAMGAPQIAKHIITIAGTNGKGSCVCWAEAICKAHGVSVASFSSPHLLDYRERIRFNAEMVDGNELCEAFDYIDEKRDGVSLTYFEWAALAAFWLMAKKRPQIAVLEVGLGGRLDATNLMAADTAVFTRIGLDHQDWLGDNVEQIALEKAGIMREGQRMVFADSQPPSSLLAKAQSLHAKIWRYQKAFSVKNTDGRLHLTLPQGQFAVSLPKYMFGTHQYGHFAAIAATLGQWFDLQQSALNIAVEKARNPARLMIKSGRPRYIIDVAHNADSSEILADFLREQRQENERMHIVCAMLKDKDHLSVLRALAQQADGWYFAGLEGKRGMSGDVLAEKARQVGIDVNQIHVCETVCEALAMAEKSACIDDCIVVMGSFVTVAEVLTQWKENE